jgi:hypothetical protein
MDLNAVQASAMVGYAAAANLLTYLVRLGWRASGTTAKVLAFALTVACVLVGMWQQHVAFTVTNAVPIMSGALILGQTLFYKFIGLDGLKTAGDAPE